MTLRERLRIVIQKCVNEAAAVESQGRFDDEWRPLVEQYTKQAFAALAEQAPWGWYLRISPKLVEIHEGAKPDDGHDYRPLYESPVAEQRPQTETKK